MAFNRRYATPMAIATAMAVVSLATPLALPSRPTPAARCAASIRPPAR